jgi:hypothetical protein
MIVNSSKIKDYTTLNKRPVSFVMHDDVNKFRGHMYRRYAIAFSWNMKEKLPTLLAFDMAN